MSRLPVVSSDGNAWGTVLNDFLSQAHNADGSIKNLFFNVKDPAYGAKGDGKTVTDGAITTGTAILTSATAGFTAADVGKVITVNGAGAAGVNLTTTIASFTNGTTVVLTANAGTSVTAATFFYATDDTTAIAAARSAARSAGGGVIFYPTGVYLSGNQDISLDKFIYHRGCGVGASTIKLKPGANTDLFSAQTSLIDITGNSTNGAGTLYNFGFSDLTIDGNKANQTAGPCYPLRFYGYSYRMQNLEVMNGYSGNIQCDWSGGNSFATDSMESQWINVKTHDSGGIGIQYAGPHDSQFMDIIPFKEASHCLHLCPKGAGAMFKNLHAWYPGSVFQAANRPITTYDWDSFARSDQSGLGTSSSGKTYTVTVKSGTQTAAIVTLQGKFTGTAFPTESQYILGSATLTDGQYYIESTEGGSVLNQVYLLWRYQDSLNFYKLGLYNGLFSLQKVVAGTPTTLASGSFVPTTTTTLYSMRVQMVGTAIKVRWWLTGQCEPVTWNLTATDSAFASGKYGFGAYIEASGNPVCQNYYVQSVYTTNSGKVCLLLEANGCQFDGCSVESSDVTQLVWLSSGSVWAGGQVYDFTTSYSTGIQIGQQAGETPYAGQILQSGGVTNGMGPIHNRIITYIQDCQGPNGALWLDNDGGYNHFDISINLDLLGVEKTGTLHAKSNYRSSFDDGTHLTSSSMVLDSNICINKGSTLYSGGVAPATTLGNVGDYYFRYDTPGTLTQRLYIKTGSAVWSDLQTPVQSATAVAIATAGTITTAALDVSRLAPTANVTGIILQAGTYAGQVIKVINESAFTLVMAASGTSHVASGILCQINPLTAMTFIYDTGTSLWYQSDVAMLPVQSATAFAIGASGAIPTAGLDVSRLAPTAARTGITMVAGTYAGQKCFVINESANLLTYNATPATSLIANSATVTTLPVTSGRLFVWDSVTGLWY